MSSVSSCCLAAFAGSAQAARYDAHTVIVKFSSGASTAERAALLSSAGVTGTTGHVAGVGADVVTVTGDPAATAARLNRSALVSYAEPNFILKATATPNDPMYPQLYGLNNTGQTGGRPDADIDAPGGLGRGRARRLPGDGRREDRHRRHRHRPDPSRAERQDRRRAATRSAAPSSSGECTDDSLHGTHVAGTITAKANNATGVAGVDSELPAW